MKYLKNFTIFFVIGILSFGTLQAQKVWRVNNRSLNGMNVSADFRNLPDAVNAAAAGDTIYLEGPQSGSTNYGSVTITKKLTIIGPGYWLSNHDTTQAYKQGQGGSSITFNPGSEGSVVEGCNLSYAHIYTSDITVRKNYLSRSQYPIYIDGPCKNIIIEQNYINSWYYYYSKYATIHLHGIADNVIIRNNVLYNSSGSGYPVLYMLVSSINHNIVINNNIIYGNVGYTNHAVFFNNIMINGSAGGAANIYVYNMCNGTQFPNNGYGNQHNVDMNTVFKSANINGPDDNFILKAGSPAIGAGVNGGDMGIFGYKAAGKPYVISGMPAIPSIFEASVPKAPFGSNTITVTAKAATHNQTKSYDK